MNRNELTGGAHSPDSGTHRASWSEACEKVLIAAAQAGKREAFDELVARQRAGLHRAARRFRVSYEDAEDLVQDAILRALINLKTFRSESNFSTWIVAILNNSALSLKRRDKRVRWFSLDTGSDESQTPGNWDIPDERIGPEQEAIRRELLITLQAVVLKQSRKHQIILEKCLFENRPIRELALSLGLTVSSAKSSLFRAKRKVADSFLRRGIVNRRRDRSGLRAYESAEGR